MYQTKEYKKVIRNIVSLLIGLALLSTTLPSLFYMLFKVYVVVEGECVIEKSG